jgi:hypothetical protein
MHNAQAFGFQVAQLHLYPAACYLLYPGKESVAATDWWTRVSVAEKYPGKGSVAATDWWTRVSVAGYRYPGKTKLPQKVPQKLPLT